jgi:pimeloyl-ACP methyl ester carboxylesterase
MVLTCAAVTEAVLESSAFERLTEGQTFADVGGRQVRYVELGRSRPGPTVVLLNGFTGSLEQWAELQPRLAERYATLAYDRGGFGLTAPLDSHTAGAQADELAALLDARHIRDPIVLVGFSSSAAIARVFVGRYRKRVAGLLMIEPNLHELEGKGPSKQGPFRMYLRTMMSADLSSFFGVRRLSTFVRRMRGRGPSSPLEERATEVLQRAQNWIAVTEEWLMTRTSQREVIAAGDLRGVPTSLITTDGWGQGEYKAVLDALYAEFLKSSPRGTLIHFEAREHGQLVHDQEGATVIRDAIASLIAARSNGL